jgi:hypothetical protein
MTTQHDFECLAVDKQITVDSMQLDDESDESIPTLQRIGSSASSLCFSDGICMSADEDNEFVKEQMLILLALTSKSSDACSEHNHFQPPSAAMLTHSNVPAPPPRRYYVRFWTGISKRLLKRSQAAEQPLSPWSCN